MIAASPRTMLFMTSMREATGLDVAAVRDHCPSLGRTVDGVPIAYLDGPGGTQVTRACIEAMTAYLKRATPITVAPLPPRTRPMRCSTRSMQPLPTSWAPTIRRDRVRAEHDDADVRDEPRARSQRAPR